MQGRGQGGRAQLALAGMVIAVVWAGVYAHLAMNQNKPARDSRASS